MRASRQGSKVLDFKCLLAFMIQLACLYSKDLPKGFEAKGSQKG